jgi:hypothetical protein
LGIILKNKPPHLYKMAVLGASPGGSGCNLSEFEASLGYIARYCFKKEYEKKERERKKERKKKMATMGKSKQKIIGVG